MPHEVLEHRVFLGRELDALAVSRDLTAAGVEHQTIHLQRRRRDRLRTAPQRFHPREQLFEREWFRDVVIGAHAQRLHLEVHRVLRRQHEHRQAHAAIAQRSQHIDAGDSWQPEIEDHDIVVCAPPAGALEPLVAVPHELDVVPRLVETAAHVVSYRLVVLDDQDLHPTGRNTLKLVPTPICDSTSMRPRCSSTMPYATDNPRPVPRPCGLVVKNGSKIFGKSSCGIPVPVSMNSTRISSWRCGLRCVRTVNTPRAFMASMALSISAMKHCTSRSASAGNGGSAVLNCRSMVSHLKRS